MRTMTGAEKEAQRRSFAYGNANIDNPLVTREMVDAEAQKLASPPPPATSGDDAAPVAELSGVRFTFDPARCNHMGKAAIDCPHCLRHRIGDLEQALNAPAPVPADLADAAKAAVFDIAAELYGNPTDELIAKVIVKHVAPLLAARDAQTAAVTALLTEAADIASKAYERVDENNRASTTAWDIYQSIAALLKRAPTAGAALLERLRKAEAAVAAYRRLDDAQYEVGEALSRQPGNDAELAAANTEFHDARIAALEAQQGERTEDGKVGQTT